LVVAARPATAVKFAIAGNLRKSAFFPFAQAAAWLEVMAGGKKAIS
jgi:hypothetical protein